MSVQRYAHFGAVVCLTALIALCVAWELWLAPLRPGGSWMVLKGLPLLLPLFGVLHGNVYTFQWSAMLAIGYFIEGVMRGFAEHGSAALLAHAETAFALGYIACAIVFVRASRRTPTPAD